VVGELHHPKRPEPAEEPHWLTIPDRGLYTGIAIFGAIGSGKTSCCIYPFAEQILAYRAGDRDRRAAGFVLEVKGDFCHKVRKILKAMAGRMTTSRSVSTASTATIHFTMIWKRMRSPTALRAS